MNFKEKLLTPEPIIIDGGMGSLLFQKIPGYAGSFELLNVEKPEILQDIHRQYFEAGSELVETNTFGGSIIKLAEYGLDHRCAEINEAGAALARKVADEYNGFVGGSVGPTGRLIEPMGETPAEEIYKSYAEQMIGLERGGAHVIAIETMNDIQEAKLALMAARDNTSLPVICSMTFEENGKTMTGTDMLTAFSTLSEYGAQVVGANCSMGPAAMVKIFQDNIQALSRLGIPLSVWSNAGLPEMIDGRTVYRLSADSFAASSLELADMGVKVIGGCCGTTPEHIAALKKAVSGKTFSPRRYERSYSYITSRSKVLDLEKHRGLILLGERLNPTARKKFAEDLREGRQTFLRAESRKQVEEGAHILDINVGVPSIDETTAMNRSIITLSSTVDVPLMIDSDNAEVIERALLTYPGIPIVNSINGKEKSIRTVIPLLKRFGCFVVALCLDDSGVHQDAEKRIAAGQRLLDTLHSEGIDLSRVFVDPLILAESAEPGSALETLKVIEYFSKKGIKTSIGLSNISFGLPQRKHINTVFLNLALARGLTAAIINPSAVRIIDQYSTEEQLALEFLEGSDPGAARYIAHFRESSAVESGASPGSAAQRNSIEQIFYAVVEGNVDDIEEQVRTALKEHDPPSIMNQGLLRALEKVGELYSTGEYFLPQMIASANTMKKGFNILKPLLAGESAEKRGKVVICTVKGDIHDIGKNIVAMMMENHGFEVRDLGKDVPAETIIQAARDISADLICLSSLLTTTMNEMRNISELLKEAKLDIPLLVGGAVVNEEYAKSIGAHYGKDAVDGVNKAKSLMAR
ncbi:MAG: 5-methyltetrahydrofolate--homocysteine methyltransferase [Spirochaetae bacterium HGW-Spirochaetae-1]|jgi:5-methyltetrahydrofolate--homocysteine methyltransferase|nr:MAG: 5-methyltetrahydrofolate--homocysteine methyltransferase [Spirochaetae bacterium HGW-Spirochaetae-1]